MELKPYHILVQLIPGSFFFGIIVLNEFKPKQIGGIDILFFIVLAFVAGYLLNGLSHLAENLFKRRLEKWIRQTIADIDSSNAFIRLFRWFSSVRTIEETRLLTGDPHKNNNVNRVYSGEDILWTKDERKFSRVFLFTTVCTLLYFTNTMTGSIMYPFKTHLVVFFLLLILTAFYRYMEYSIDYIYKKDNKKEEE